MEDGARFATRAANGVTAYSYTPEDATQAAFSLFTDGEPTPIKQEVWSDAQGDYLPAFGTYGNIG